MKKKTKKKELVVHLCKCHSMSTGGKCCGKCYSSVGGSGSSSLPMQEVCLCGKHDIDKIPPAHSCKMAIKQTKPTKKQLLKAKYLEVKREYRKALKDEDRYEMLYGKAIEISKKTARKFIEAEQKYREFKQGGV